jgi:hypothetical protein
MERLRLSGTLFTTVLYVVASGLVFYLFLNFNGTFGLDQGPGTLHPMIDGTAAKPFVFRTLVPSTIGWVAGQVPGPVKERVRAAFEANDWLGKFFRIDYSFEAIVAIIVMYCCYAAVPFVLRKLLRVMLPGPRLLEEVAPAVGMLFLPFLFLYNHYVYDPATLLLFAVASLLLAQKRFVLFYPVFLLAALNKETSILLLPVFLLAAYRDMKRPLLAAHLASLALLWLAVKAFVSARFASNPGAFLEFHLFDHNLALLEHPLALSYALVVTLFFGWLAARNWSAKPLLARQGFLVIIGSQAVMALFFGYLDELRQYYEAMPFFFVLAVASARSLFPDTQAGGGAGLDSGGKSARPART